jgi:hypothetical protein
MRHDGDDGRAVLERLLLELREPAIEPVARLARRRRVTKDRRVVAAATARQLNIASASR